MITIAHTRSDRRLAAAYVACDFMLSLVAVVVFQVARFYLNSPYFDGTYTLADFLGFSTVIAEIIGLPFLMVGAYWLSGFYSAGVDGKSRLGIIGNTLIIACIVALLFFVTAVINDSLPRRRIAYLLAVILAGALTLFPLIGRLALCSSAARRFQRGECRKRAAVLGTGAESLLLARRIARDGRASWFSAVCFVTVDPTEGAYAPLPVIDIEELKRAVAEGRVEAILVPPEFPSDTVLKLLNLIYDLPIEMYAAPALGNLLTPLPRICDVNNEPLVNILKARIHPGVANLKRVSDLMMAAFGLLALSPLIAGVAIAVKASSPGPVFFRQERLGRYRKPFKILKFRTMAVDAEAAGPMLSSGDSDPRITPLGRLLRKYRIDEIPNLWNVLRGDMSLVGPRPERPFFVSQITRRAPAYGLLYNVRPGLTSWGMVRFGYAQNVDEMIERMRYDLLYIENLSFGVDLRIIIHTIATIFKGKGK